MKWRRDSISLLILIAVILIIPNIIAEDPLPQEMILGVPWMSQQKDTHMLCLEGCPEHGEQAWDSPHDRSTMNSSEKHGWNYCARTATAIIANYFLDKQFGNKHLSIERIAYKDGNDIYPPEYDLSHGGTGVEELAWALNVPEDVILYSIQGMYYTTYDDFKEYIAQGRPIIAIWEGHERVLDGYRDEGPGNRYVHIVDPGWSSLDLVPEEWKWVEWSDMPYVVFCIPPAQAPGVRSDEDTLWIDSDSDGITDFDEIERFNTDPFDSDTDNDLVLDKYDMREYVFDQDGNYGPPAFLDELRIDLITEYPTMLNGQYLALLYLSELHPIFKANNYNLETGADEGWHDIQLILDKVRWRADFDDDGLRKELDPDNDNDGLWDGMEDKNRNGIFEPELGETSNFNPDRDAPVTSIIIGDPYDLNNSGLCYIKSATSITLIPGDSGPVEFRGIQDTFYRYYPLGTDPPDFNVYSDPFNLTGSDGNYTLEFYSQDIAGNIENLQIAPLFLDNIPPQVSFLINGYEPYLEGNMVNIYTTFNLLTNDTGSGILTPQYRIISINGSFNSGWISYVDPFNLVQLPEGEYNIQFNIFDRLGTKAMYTQIPILLDNSPPSTEIIITPSTPNGENSWYNTGVWISFSCEDNIGGSGVDYIEYSFDSGDTWITNVRSIFPVIGDGEYILMARSVDNSGNIEDSVIKDFKIDTTCPEVTIDNPIENESIQDTITILINTIDGTSEVENVLVTIGEYNSNMFTPIPIHENNSAVYNPLIDKWEYMFDSTEVSDGYYGVKAKAIDNAGNEQWTDILPFSIRNWAVLELLPNCQSYKAGRTMPIKFSLRIDENVDSLQPFVRNENLLLKIFKIDNNILQLSYYGYRSIDYRIDSDNEFYITNFKTDKKPSLYVVKVLRPNINFIIGSFVFETTK
jgi:hypothetical protein